MTPDERFKNAVIYGTSHPEVYMTKPDELWEKHTACGAESGYMIYEEFLAALQEYGESVRQQAVRVCKDSGYGHPARLCIKAIEKMEIGK